MRVTIYSGRLFSAGANRSAFSLIELLVVLVIMGILAVFTLPAMKNMRQSNALVSAGRQLVDDFARARNRAILDQTDVYVVFIPPAILFDTFNLSPQENKLAERLRAGAFTSYAIVAERSVGDQPGRGVARYITEWQSLPDGVIIATNKLLNPTFVSSDRAIAGLPYRTFKFPTGTNDANIAKRDMPFIGFDKRGRLLDPIGPGSGLAGEIIPLLRGSILYARDAAGNLLTDSFDVRQSSTNFTERHYVVVDGLTGRARVETQALY